MYFQEVRGGKPGDVCVILDEITQDGENCNETGLVLIMLSKLLGFAEKMSVNSRAGIKRLNWFILSLRGQPAEFRGCGQYINCGSESLNVCANVTEDIILTAFHVRYRH
ncbi:hypothetical protein PoB_000109300 [Plakobranchus ocellatus]|uniref:Uncharacterized protein n=1 Tax=Plakobranchus ocellatus TaxID=259542 RepID=A0AAV3XX71_9GAST|nr:hypothetical protein PoB_000109300 [Plakobranchus ocellatus]